MEASELRIGNLVDFEKQSFIITRIKDIDFCQVSLGKTSKREDLAVHITAISPIPLTEEWLVNLGFDKWNNIQIGADVSCDHLNLTKFGDTLIYDQEGDFIVLKQTEYVHSLQNLYFALTGKELKLNA